MSDITFDDLVKALATIKGDCDHTLAYYINPYWGVCKCGRENYLMAPPDLREWYNDIIDNILKSNNNKEPNIEKVCGIDFIGSEKSVL